jgi:acyl carrier protein
VDFGHDEALARIELPQEFLEDLTRVKLHPAILDIATSCALPLIKTFDPTAEFYVPVSCSSVRIYKGLPGSLYSHLCLRNSSDANGFVSFDVTLLDAGGAEIVSIEDFTFRRTSKASLASSAGTEPAVASRRCVALNPGSTAGRLRRGIRPEKGGVLFERAIRSARECPEIFISPQDLSSRGRSDDSGIGVRAPDSVGTVPSTQHASHPDVPGGSDQDDVEQKISRIWQTILGVERIGPHLNFFASGADSLSALRALAGIKRELKIGLSVPNLYDHPTVEQLAGLIRLRRSSE